MFLKLHKGVFYPFVSWMRQSKQQPEEDVDTGGYLKTRRRLELSPSSPSVLSLFLRSRLHYPAGRLDRKLSCSSCAAAHSYPSQVFLAKVSGHPLAFVPLLISDIQDLSRIFPPGRIITTCFLVSLLSETTSYFGNPSFSIPALLSRTPRPQFSLHSVCTKAQHVPPSQWFWFMSPY